jgi:hypothetical protein
VTALAAVDFSALDAGMGSNDSPSISGGIWRRCPGEMRSSLVLFLLRDEWVRSRFARKILESLLT